MGSNDINDRFCHDPQRPQQRRRRRHVGSGYPPVMVLVVLMVVMLLFQCCWVPSVSVVQGQRVLSNLGVKLEDSSKNKRAATTKKSGPSSFPSGMNNNNNKKKKRKKKFQKGEEDYDVDDDNKNDAYGWIGALLATVLLGTGSDQEEFPSPRTVIMGIVVVLMTMVGTQYHSLLSKYDRSISDPKSASSDKPIGHHDDIVVEDDHVMAMGGLESVDLGFSGLYLEMKQKKKKRTAKKDESSSNNNSNTRLLLDGSIRGRARPGRMLAIMGPSGAGKSTVLHALAGRIKASSKLRLKGRRYINGQPITGDSQVPSAFVEQEVSFFPHMTVRETLAFRVELKLGSLISKQAQADRVEELIEELNLGKAADTIVGDAKVRGISGGERRRLAIACELVSSPSMIFLDEPTSGLDSTAATSIVESLRSLADSGKTVVAVIHQPSQHVFDAFDDLLLLSDGKQMYFGEVSNVRNYMDSHVKKAPSGMGTAEHVLDCISKFKMPGESDENVKERMTAVATLANSADIAVGAPVSTAKSMEHYGDSHIRRANIFVQFKLLLRRSLRENFRGKAALIIKLVQQVSLGLIYGSIYSLDLSQASIQNRFGLLSLIAIGSANMAMASTVRSFPKEKAIVSNELGANMYGTLPYFIGKAISEIPLTVFLNSVFGFLVSSLTGLNGTWQKLKQFLGMTSLNTLSGQAAGLMLGAIAPSQDASLALFPAIMVLNIIFDGKNISEESTPRLLRWLPKVGLIRWGFEGLCLNEFEGLQFDTKSPHRGPAAKNGVDALSRFGLGQNTLSDVVKAQLLIISGSWFFSYLGLTLTRQKFQYMEEPKEEKEK